jgi:thiol-disulfide isomerase/thioredoxin
VLAPLAGESLLEPGRTLSTDAYRGQVVVLNIWGSWCGPCRGEAPALEEVAAASAPRGVAFLGIDVRDSRDAAADFVRDRGVGYPSLYDPPGRSLLVLRGYPRNAVPSTIVLDRSHRVAAVFLTAVLASELQPVVDRIAAEPATAP